MATTENRAACKRPHMPIKEETHYSSRAVKEFKNGVRALMVALTCSLSLPALAGDVYPRPQAVDGCSGGGNMAGDYMAAISFFNSRPAHRAVCDRHDKCYATVGNSKKSCDNTLRDHLEGECRNAYPITQPWKTVDRTLCLGKAAVMYKAVDIYGQSSYNAAQQQTMSLLTNYPKSSGASPYNYPFMSISHVALPVRNAIQSAAVAHKITENRLLYKIFAKSGANTAAAGVAAAQIAQQDLGEKAAKVSILMTFFQ